MRLGQPAVLHAVLAVLFCASGLACFQSSQVDKWTYGAFASTRPRPAVCKVGREVSYAVTRYLERELRARGVRRILRVPQ